MAFLSVKGVKNFLCFHLVSEIHDKKVIKVLQRDFIKKSVDFDFAYKYYLLCTKEACFAPLVKWYNASLVRTNR